MATSVFSKRQCPHDQWVGPSLFNTKRRRNLFAQEQSMIPVCDGVPQTPKQSMPATDYNDKCK